MSYPLHAFCKKLGTDVEAGRLMLLRGDWWLKLQENEGQSDSLVLTGPNAGKFCQSPTTLLTTLSPGFSWQITVDRLTPVEGQSLPEVSPGYEGPVLHGRAWHIAEIRFCYNADGSENIDGNDIMDRVSPFSVWLVDAEGHKAADVPLFTTA
ncbi:hypothetical protein [Xanthomonas sp. 60]